MKTSILRIFFFIVLIFNSPLLHAELRGKVDAGAAFAEINIISNGSEVKSLDLYGGGANATVVFYSGWCLKPRFLILDGDAEYYTTDIGLGFYVPIGDCWSLTPVVGVTQSRLKFLIDIPMFALSNVEQKFTTFSRYVALDGSWRINPKVMLSCSIQYAWARTHTTVGSLISTRTESRGFNITVAADYFLTDHWSLNIAIADMRSMSKEKDGSKGKGGRIGVGYCF